MKTSNKLLLGLFVAIVVSMISVNLTIKHEIDKNLEKLNQNIPGLHISVDEAEKDSL